MKSDFDLRLAGFLSASESRSGEAIAAELGCSRTAVWKHIESLRTLGIAVDAVAGQGYRLHEPLELLDEKRVHAGLSAQARKSLGELLLLPVVDSTNDFLQSQPRDRQTGLAVLAECQTAGRGRRGQTWVSPYGRNIYLSLGWTFNQGAAGLACLPLLLALSACDALDQSGLKGHGIKWPNDLLIGNHKLGGCLVEVQGDVNGPCHAVLGVGINVRMPAGSAAAAAIDQPWTDVASHVSGVSRNRLAGDLLNLLLVNLEQFAFEGFEVFQQRWQQWDLLYGQALELRYAGRTVRGVSEGISERGALLIRDAEGVGEYAAGEISMVRKGISA